MHDFIIAEPSARRDHGYKTLRTSSRKLEASTTRNDGSIDMLMSETINYDESGRCIENMQFHNYNRKQIKQLRDFLTEQLNDRKYW